MTSRSLAHPVQFSLTKLVLWALVAIAVVVAGIRFTSGMGAVSNLSNAYSWGVWISLDLLCGVALAAGAFTTCAAVYILNLKEFMPLTRPAILTGFLGYLMVVVALLVDLGRPERIWHMLIYWNPHSPLFEVGLCVMTYTTVLALEFSPLLFERLRWHRAARVIHSLSIPLIILGVLLSTLHQSSLGSLFLITADKLHPLWHSPLLPVFFFLSAATAGLAMVVVESSISAHAYGRPPETHLLARLVKAIPWLLGLHLAVKLAELAWAGDLALLSAGTWQTWLFGTELLVGVLIPFVLFSLQRVRQNPSWLFGSALLVVLGLMFNRFNVGLIAWQRPAGAAYFPHWMELSISFGIIAAGVLAYDWVARHLPLFDHGHGEGSSC